MSLIPGATGTPSSFPDGFQVAGNGSPATPAFTFLSPSNNTGMYSPGDDQIAFSSNGVRSLLVGSSGEFIIGPSSGAGLTHTIQSGGGTTLLNLTSSAGAFSTQIKFNAAGGGNGGILIPASGSFTFRNNTDTTTFGEVSLGGAWSFGVVPGSGSSALSHTFQADGSVSVFLNTSTHSDASPLLRFRRGGSDRASIGIAGAGAGSIGSISSPNDFIIYTNGYPFKISTDTAANTALSITTSGAVTLGPNSFSGLHNINGIVRVVVPGATTGGFRLSGATSESHLQFLGTNASTNGSLRFYSYRSDLSNEKDVGLIDGDGTWTLGPAGNRAIRLHGPASEVTFFPDVDADRTLFVNYNGYNGGTTRFRSISFYNGKNTSIGSYDNAGTWTFGAGGSSSIHIFNGSTSATVNGNFAVKGSNSTSTASSGARIFDAQYTGDADCTGGYFFHCINSSGSTIGRIEATSNTGVVYSVSSDERLKQNPISFNGLDMVMQMLPKEFAWVSNPNRREKGFYAQEMFLVCPEVVSVGSDELTDDGSIKTPWSMDYGKLTPVLVKAIQELKAELDVAKAQIQTLLNP